MDVVQFKKRRTIAVGMLMNIPNVMNIPNI